MADSGGPFQKLFPSGVLLCQTFLYTMGACVAWVDDVHSTRPMVLAAFPAVAIMQGTTASVLFFPHCYLPSRDNRNIMRWQRAPHPSPHSAPIPRSSHFCTSVEPTADELHTSARSSAAAGHTLPATTSCSASWPNAPIHLVLSAQVLHCTCAEELHAAAGTARRPPQRKTRHSSLSPSGPSALRVLHAPPSMYTAASSLRSVGAIRASCWPRGYIAQPLAWTSRLTGESLDGGSGGYSRGARGGHVNCDVGGGRKR